MGALPSIAIEARGALPPPGSLPLPEEPAGGPTFAELRLNRLERVENRLDPLKMASHQRHPPAPSDLGARPPDSRWRETLDQRCSSPSGRGREYVDSADTPHPGGA
jgi:hypothetical protein